VTIPATVPQGSEIPEGLMNNPVFFILKFTVINCAFLMILLKWALTRSRPYDTCPNECVNDTKLIHCLL
jgi:hypothetical protein